jgi:hypothetical protein
MIDPNQALQQMLQPAGLLSTLFPPTSRYHGIETTTLETVAPHLTVVTLPLPFPVVVSA